jgi:hypothetical protein
LLVLLISLCVTQSNRLYAQTPKISKLSSADVCDDLISYKGKQVAFVGFYSASQTQNQGWSLQKRNDYNEEKMNSMMTYSFYDDNDKYYTRVVFADDCAVKLRIPYDLAKVPNVFGNGVIVVGTVVNKNTVNVILLKREEL